MPELNFLTKRVQEAGWLSIATLFFDNAYTVEVFNTNGYLAYSPAQECFFILNALDSTDSEEMMYKFVFHNGRHLGQEHVMTVVGSEHLQHFDMAMYAHSEFFRPLNDKPFPYPTIPTPAELEALQPDPDTGLYDETQYDLVYKGSTYTRALTGAKESAISMYEDFYPAKESNLYSGARITKWKQFYENHQKFLTALNDWLGVSDGI